MGTSIGRSLHPVHYASLQYHSYKPLCKPSAFHRWHTAPEICSSQWSDQPHQRTRCMHRQHKNMDNQKSAQTEWQQNRALLFSFSSSLTPSSVSLPDSITLGSHNIPFSDFARNLGFILVSKLPMKKHIVKICQTAYFELKCVSSVHMFLTEDAAKTLVTSSIPSLLDYCNCLFMGTPNSVIQPLQKIQNCAARLVLLAPCHHHSTPTLHMKMNRYIYGHIHK